MKNSLGGLPSSSKLNNKPSLSSLKLWTILTADPTDLRLSEIAKLSKKVPTWNKISRGEMPMIETDTVNKFLKELHWLKKDFWSLATVPLSKTLLSWFYETLERFVRKDTNFEIVNKYSDTIETFFWKECLFKLKIKLLKEDIDIDKKKINLDKELIESDLKSAKLDYSKTWTDQDWAGSFKQFWIDDELLLLLNKNYYLVRRSLWKPFKQWVIDNLWDDVFKYFNITVWNLENIKWDCLDRNFRILTETLKKNYESKTLWKHNSFLFKDWKKKPSENLSISDIWNLKDWIFIPFDFSSVKLWDKDVWEQIKKERKENQEIILDQLWYSRKSSYKYSDSYEDNDYHYYDEVVKEKLINEYEDIQDNETIFNEISDLQKFIIRNNLLIEFIGDAFGVSEYKLKSCLKSTPDWVNLDIISLLENNHSGLKESIEEINKHGIKWALNWIFLFAQSFWKTFSKTPKLKALISKKLISSGAYWNYDSWRKLHFWLAASIIEEFCISAWMNKSNEPILKNSIWIKNWFDVLLWDNRSKITELFSVFSLFNKNCDFSIFVTELSQKEIISKLSIILNNTFESDLHRPSFTSFNWKVVKFESPFNNKLSLNITDVLAVIAELSKSGKNYSEILWITRNSLTKSDQNKSILEIKTEFFEIFTKYVKTIGRGTLPQNRLSLMILIEDSIFNNRTDTEDILWNIWSLWLEFIPFLSNFQHKDNLKRSFLLLNEEMIADLFKEMLKKESLLDTSRETIALWERFRKNLWK